VNSDVLYDDSRLTIHDSLKWGLFMYNKLLSLKDTESVRLEYQCEECWYIVHKPLMGEDISLYLDRWNDYLTLNCPSCGEKTMIMSGLFSEEEWVVLHKYAEG